MNSAFRFSVSLSDADGASLGQHPLDPDDEPALQAFSFDVLKRTGRLPGADTPAAIAPVWHPQKGEPVISGLRVFRGDDAIVLGTDALSQPVRSALRELVDAKKIPGESIAV